MRRLELYQATLLPNRETKVIQQEMDKLRVQIFEANHDGEIEERERQYAEKVSKGLHKAPRKKKKVVGNG